MAKTIEKITETDPPKANGKREFTVTEKIVLRRASFRFLLAILILGLCLRPVGIDLWSKFGPRMHKDTEDKKWSTKRH